VEWNPWKQNEEKAHTQGEKEMQQEMSQWVVFVKENSCNRFYSKVESFFDPLVVVGFSLQGRKLVQALHRKRLHRAEKHMVNTCDFRLDIKALEFPRYGIYSFMTRCNFLHNQIRL